eukprot:CAMPEP_0117438284 /NCGR_PEP_ID=MMETSP0759-20121206/1974_1 /TAXON_ID=63605 /ORGANISM="Percolomonas cosmopolitus, Strain WS" /LENGTH=631 /DNA_ID=CAMNT_0005229971 /DNA_START=96 /DNA_END=1991 /DNA_ORIENTATION=+
MFRHPTKTSTFRVISNFQISALMPTRSNFHSAAILRAYGEFDRDSSSSFRRERGGRRDSYGGDDYEDRRGGRDFNDAPRRGGRGGGFRGGDRRGGGRDFGGRRSGGYGDRGGYGRDRDFGRSDAEETLVDEYSTKNFLEGKQASKTNMDHLEDADVQISGIDPVAVKVFGEKKHLADYENILHDKILENLKRSGFDIFTPIQRYTLPFALKKRADLLGNAQTGSGKTIAFIVPIINDLLENDLRNTERHVARATPRVLIMAPTRELATQLEQEFQKYARGTGLRSQLIIGGGSVEMCRRLLLEKNPEVLVCTPGRTNAFLEEYIISLGQTRSVVLDEADLMMDMGFMPQISKLFNHSEMPSTEHRQTFLFSATMPSQIQSLTNTFMKPSKMHVQIGQVGKPGQHITQEFHAGADFRQKCEIIKDAMHKIEGLALIFTKTKASTLTVAMELKRMGIASTLINGNMKQSARNAAIEAFKKGRVQVMCATDIASRGLDIPMVDLVVNFDMPNDAESFVHRIGRTGRVGRKGHSLSFVDAVKDGDALFDIVKMLKKNDIAVSETLYQEAMRVRDPGVARERASANSRRGGRGGGFGGGRGGGGGRGRGFGGGRGGGYRDDRGGGFREDRGGRDFF